MTRTYSDRSVAKRYDAARALPVETTRQWMAELKALLPGGRVRAVLDLGCGTGRFAGALRETFACPVVAIDPSVEMLEQATTRGLPGVEWRQGSAEETPLGDGTVDLVWMSQVFHHLDDLEGAMGEIRRVLSDDGILAIRNGTRENDAEIEWYRFFPEVREMDAGRIPSRQQIVDAVTAYGFRLLGQRTVDQYFAASHSEYVDKIGRRGLSSLIALDDEAFHAGMSRLRAWAREQAHGVPVHEPVDLFLFGNGRPPARDVPQGAHRTTPR